MPVSIYPPCINPISGETFIAISFNETAFAMQWTVQPKECGAFENIHLHQDEIFYVKEVEIKILMDGKEYVGRQHDRICDSKEMPRHSTGLCCRV